jgi:hypothetical protein
MAENNVDLAQENALLKARIAELEKGVTVREKIDVMSSEVVDSNPYRCAKLMHSLTVQPLDGFTKNGYC